MTRRVASEIPAPIDATFDASCGAGDARSALITRLSVAGAELETSEAPPVGTEVQVRAFLGDTPRESCLTGRVRWMAQGRIGVQLESVGVRETRAILRMNRDALTPAAI